MSFFSLNNRFKHRNFDYVPRFYDADKEEREARKAKYSDADKDNPELLKTRIKGGFSKPMGRSYQSDAYRKAVRKSNKVVMVVMMILVLVMLYFLVEYFPRMVETFDQ